ncbi:MAG: DUF1573 domain-containing protein [Pirellulales bacterium]|nr:DUF1573 domain-containing protein [Pirellulales bacterium]
MRRSSTIAAVVFSGLFAVSASAQQWAMDMFKVTNHDFGSVARGAKAEFAFPVTNPYLEDVHVAGVRSSCNCTTPRIVKPDLKTYETGAIVAHINTDRFLGGKGATITVTFDKPYHAEVRLHVNAYIRSDVVFEPGSVNLGEVDQGKPSEQKVRVQYAGRNDWRIQEVRSDNPHLAGQIVEVSRGGGQVSYELAVHLDDDAPAGYVNDHLILVTNDNRMTQVPVAVEGRVVSGVTVSPARLFMGVVKPGEEVKKQLVVRGKKPFRIVSITCDDGSFKVDPSVGQEPKELHVVPITFVAGKDPGKVARTLQIETDLGAPAAELPAFVVISAE